VDWDPLRLHPPLERARSPCVYLEDKSGRHWFEDHGRRNTNLRRHHTHSYRQRQTQSGSSTIYSGFDFGFRDSVNSAAETHRRYRSEADVDWAPQPRIGRRISDYESSGSDSAPIEWGEAIMPRPHPELIGEADYFMRRGDWKRRGVVFSSPAVRLASEEDTFDIP